MATDAAQRHYRAPCPGCGAPVEFRSAQSTYAVCPFCQSTVVRSGDVLARVGKMAELFDDHSPLQLMASGRFKAEGEDLPFTLIGRAQYKSSNGVWAEWNAILDDGSMASLAEDNGSYVFSRPLTLQRQVPTADQFRVGMTTAINGKPYSVAFNEQVTLISAQGELPRLAPLGTPFSVVELRGADGDVISIDYSSPEVVPATQAISRGRAVLLEDLQFKGLKDESVREEKGRQFACPHCGAPVQVVLDTTKSITCSACNSIIDLSSGLGGELRHAEQDEPIKTLIPLGTKGQLQGVQWQVVGFQHRMGQEPGDDEQFGWDEYLLYNRKRGFSFLVDSSDGWSIVKPATGAPTMANRNSQSATYLGTTYALQYSYEAETTYVAGEFYWPVSRGQKTFNRDFASANGLLSQEQTPTEVTWSVGSKISSDAVAKAFKLEDKAALLGREDVKPFSAAPQVSLRAIIIILVLIVLVIIIMSSCSGSSGGSSRSSGGSYGGFSSGGGHK
ncbi:DUF4178 domain-containing protein [Ottowia thiooxydans]|uniref:DUF4178 domain-containing protein n=1 Tax=Ottowia thiooxydans TaxID=219182 RepID=UPI00048D7389|nr:DUF4178 domain-containing protein [Ottowia thiooxydans]